MLRVVVDTNLWVRALLGGRKTLPLLESWRAGKFTVVVSHYLIDELDKVCHRARLRKHIYPIDLNLLLEQLHYRGEMVEPTSIPPRCRDPKDNPVLATAIDGKVDAIVTGDSDLRADYELRSKMEKLGIAIWGVETLLIQIEVV